MLIPGSRKTINEKNELHMANTFNGLFSAFSTVSKTQKNRFTLDLVCETSATMRSKCGLYHFVLFCFSHIYHIFGIAHWKVIIDNKKGC